MVVVLAGSLHESLGEVPFFVRRVLSQRNQTNGALVVLPIFLQIHSLLVTIVKHGLQHPLGHHNLRPVSFLQMQQTKLNILIATCKMSRAKQKMAKV